MEALREQWLVYLPYMDSSNYIDFDEYYYKFRPNKMKAISRKSREEIIKEGKEILRKLEK